MDQENDGTWQGRIMGDDCEPLPLKEELLVLGHVNNDSKDAPPELRSYNPVPTPPASGYGWTGPLSAQLPKQGGFDKDPPGIDRWPRRLLKIFDDSSGAEMLSLSWTPGNDYVGTRRNGRPFAIKEPRYNAISYTWGRYWLDGKLYQGKAKRYRNVHGIAIDGLSWDVPKIDPARFTVETFDGVLRRTSDITKKGSLVWVDVACIDQKNKAVRGLEIGRQAEIFKNAMAVTVWLHEHDAATLRSLSKTLDTHGKIDYALDVKPLHTALDTLFKDTWFTSTWTLQEAFLSQKNAVFLSKDGQSVPDFTLGRLVEVCSEINDGIEQLFNQTGYWSGRTRSENERLLDGITNMISSRGLLALAQNSPFALYSASRWRTSFYDWDKVYGIQQVFGLRVGNTIPGTDPAVKYTRIELEAQLGALILSKYPVESQLHVFAEPVEPGRGWHISLSSYIPRFNLSQALQNFEFRPLCSLEAVDDPVKRLPVARSRGETCAFVNLQKDWQNSDDKPLNSGKSDFRSTHQISLDTIWLQAILDQMEEKPEFRTWGHKQDIRSGRAQHTLAGRMVDRFGHDGLLVLRLGSFFDQEFGEHYCGLILQDKEEVKNRIGICIWNLSQTFQDEREHWKQGEVSFM